LSAQGSTLLLLYKEGKAHIITSMLRKLLTCNVNAGSGSSRFDFDFF